MKGVPFMCLAKNIRYLRLKKNFSQDYIASRLGYKSYTTIQKWESGVSEPPVAKLRQLADLLDVDIDDIATKDIEAFEKNGYYADAETDRKARKAYVEHRLLFEAIEGSKKEDIQMAIDLLNRLKETNRDG